MVRDELINLLIDCQAVRYGDFTLASGKKSRVYVDIKKAVTQPTILKVIAREIAQLQETYDMTAGVAVGGIPLAVAVSLETSKPYAIIRKEEKSHGLTGKIIGEVSGMNILLVEDVTTSGGSAVYGIDILRSAGATVRTVVSIVDRDDGADTTLSALGVSLIPLISLRELLSR